MMSVAETILYPLSACSLLQKTRLSGSEGLNVDNGMQHYVWRRLNSSGQWIIEYVYGAGSHRKCGLKDQ